MVNSMCQELGQADLKAIGRSRGFEPEITASRALMEHALLSEQGVATAIAMLTTEELAVLHLLNCLRDQVNLEFFKRLYPASVSSNLYASYNDRFKALFHEVKTRLIQRGLLLMGTLPESRLRGVTILERRRFRLPAAFGALLPAPFQARQFDSAGSGSHRREVLRDKLAELLRLGSPSADKPPGNKQGCWRLENGELRFGPDAARFRAERLEAWQRAQFEAALGYTNKAQPEALMPVPLLCYAFARLREQEWLAPEDLLPLWKLALPGAKAPEPRTVCEAGYDWGCAEKLEFEGQAFFRSPRLTDSEQSASPEDFMEVENPQKLRLRLERMPVAALERLSEISRLVFVANELWASPDLLKLSHAPAATLADPMLSWLRERHPGFRSTLEQIEQRRGKLIVHENLLVARVSDLVLKVGLERKFGGPGQMVALAGEFVAFPNGLLPEIQSWLKKSGHIIKTIESGEPTSADAEGPQDEESEDE